MAPETKVRWRGIYTNDLPNILVSCNVQMYDDDVELYASDPLKDIDSCVESFNWDLLKVPGLDIMDSVLTPLNQKAS